MPAPRGRRRKATTTAAASTSAASLVAALKFVNVAQKDIGTPHETHCVLYEHWAYAFNGVLSAGCKIADDLKACPHTARLLDALSKASDTLSITQLDSGRLSVTSGKFRALIPCANFNDIPNIFPDPLMSAIDERVTKALSIVADFATEGAQTVLAASVLLRKDSALATDRKILVEAWHGVDLPPGLVMPKSAVVALLNSGKKVKGFGCSWDEAGVFRSATFYFEDDSWIKTQLYQEAWPDCDRVLNMRQANAWPVPKGFKEAIDTLASFSDDDALYTIGNKLCSHASEDTGASVEVEGLPKGRSFSLHYYPALLKIAQTMDFGPTDADCVLFFGEGVRGAMGPRKVLQAVDSNTEAYVAGQETAAAASATPPTPGQPFAAAASAPAGFPVAFVPIPPHV